MLEHIPVGLARPFTKSEHLFPVYFVFANDCFGAAAMSFDMNGPDAAWISLQHLDRVRSRVSAIAGVELHDYFGLRIPEENVPGSLPIELFKVMRVGVIPHRHALRLDVVSQLVEEPGFIKPFLLRGGAHRWHDEKLVADGLVEFNGLLQFVFQHRLVRLMRAAGYDSVFIEHLSQLFGAAPPVTRELNALVADLRYRGQRPRQIFSALVAHRIELNANGDFARGRRERKARQAGTECDSGRADRLHKISPRNFWKQSRFHKEVLSLVVFKDRSSRQVNTMRLDIKASRQERVRWVRLKALARPESPGSFKSFLDQGSNSLHIACDHG